jgi:hypothetical protein
MNRWEYKCLKIGARELAEGTEEKLDALGAEGWEVVTAVSGERHGYAHDVMFVMKRPRP